MKNLLLLLLVVFNVSTFATTRVMTFNVTCAFCNKGEFDKWRLRKHWIVDTVKRANPDLISMQEVFFPFQLKWIEKQLKEYNVYYFKKLLILRHPDSALLIRKSRYHVMMNGSYFLGPRNGGFSLGWRVGIPRYVKYAKIYDKKLDRAFYFYGSHFDNSKYNKEPSARMFIDRLKMDGLPVIFAADTNLKPEMSGFQYINQFLYDSFDLTEKVTFVKNSNTNPDDSCNLEKGKTFPECRVDHIFLSKDHNWKVRNWAVDQYKYGEDQKFTSDHRAFYADIELLD
jgi:endonuclease/exonuclease/phosphatase family metal-dependent hydrolase